MKLIRLALAVATACSVWQAAAQHALEVIPLKHATVEQVLPTLRPLLEPGGTLTGQRGQLILRASPANVADIRRALEAIDRPPRRLQISVRFDDAAEASRRSIETRGTIGSRASELEIRAQDSRSSLDERIDQRIQVVDGGRAFITTGQSRPVRQRERIQTPAGPVGQDVFVTREVATGFEVTPRLSGDRVFLDIGSQRESFVDAAPGNLPPGTVQGQRAASSVSARLGEWLEIGAIASGGGREERGIASGMSVRGSDSRRIWVKVEELRN